MLRKFISYLSYFIRYLFLNIYAGKDGAHCFPKLFLSELGVWYLIDISDNPTSIGHNCDILNLLLFQFSTIKCGQYLLGMKVKSMLSCFFFFLFCFVLPFHNFTLLQSSLSLSLENHSITKL